MKLHGTPKSMQTAVASSFSSFKSSLRLQLSRNIQCNTWIDLVYSDHIQLAHQVRAVFSLWRSHGCLAKESRFNMPSLPPSSPSSPSSLIGVSHPIHHRHQQNHWRFWSGAVWIFFVTWTAWTSSFLKVLAVYCNTWFLHILTSARASSQDLQPGTLCCWSNCFKRSAVGRLGLQWLQLSCR